MNFTGSQFLKTASTYQTNPNGRLYLACVAEWDASNSTANFAFSSWNTTGTSANFQVSKLATQGSNKGRVAVRYTNGSLPRMDTTGSVLDDQKIITAEFGSGNNIKFCEFDGVAVLDSASQSTATSPNNVSNRIAIGARSSDDGLKMSGYVQECVIWSTTTDAYDHAAISDSINDFYNSFT